jgi:hypothetical protein
MASSTCTPTVTRRQILLGAAASCVPLSGRANIVYTPHELKQQYEREVSPRLRIPADELQLYGYIAELQLYSLRSELREPQYLLVIDSNPHVQAAMLLWRLLPSSYDLVGASPVSTTIAMGDEAIAPSGLFERQRTSSVAPARVSRACGNETQRAHSFGCQSARRDFARLGDADTRLQVQAADQQAERRLGAPCTDACVLLPSALMSFLDEYGVLDDGITGLVQRHMLPYRGRFLMFVDSQRDDRPSWSPPPKSLRIPRTVARSPG